MYYRQKNAVKVKYESFVTNISLSHIVRNRMGIKSNARKRAIMTRFALACHESMVNMNTV